MNTSVPEPIIYQDRNRPYIHNRYQNVPKYKRSIRAYFPGLRKLYQTMRYSRWARKDISKYLREMKDSTQLFDAIEFETINRCNFTCEFCPANRNSDKRPFKLMEEGLFKKIIEELSEMNYEKYLTFYSNNEPFMDSRMVEFIKYARAKLPKAFLHLYTNGSLLTVDKLKEVLPLLDLLVIDNYNDDFIMTPENQKSYDYCLENGVNLNKVIFDMRKEHEVLTSRGGQAPNKGQVKTIRAKCYLPYRQLAIRPDGKVSLCNNDVYGKYTLGDINEQTLVEVWNSKQFQDIRNTMYKTGRKNLQLCNHCDTCVDGRPWIPEIRYKEF